MQCILPSGFAICVQTVLLLCGILQVLAVDNVDFGAHVENQTGVRDSLSRRHHRVYQLYSRTSGKHLQVLGRKILARGEDGDTFAQVVVEADTFGSQKASGRTGECVFVEMVLENNYTAWMSARYAGWFVGFTKKGRPRRGPQTRANQRDVHFMKRFPPGEQPSTPYCGFTTVSKRGRGSRPNRPPSHAQP
ncbi:fibroblast growth factor 18b isoform X2 [Brachyhypopomus gauderio]|uniref:fibroblast growth factor 18b isoform X2 n=1 Tax=Brachyhypopomus gauderio TaxID=698409 RepID=UPI0040431576